MAKKQRESTTMSIEDALNDVAVEVEAIGSEFRDYCDSVSGTGFENTERYEVWSTAADEFESADADLTIPTCLDGVEVTNTSEPVPGYVSQVEGRRIRQRNVVSLIEDMLAAVEEARAEIESGADDTEDTEKGKKADDPADADDAIEEMLSEIDIFIDELETLRDTIDSVEF